MALKKDKGLKMNMPSKRDVLAGLSGLALGSSAACAQTGGFKVEEFSQGFDQPWGMAFLPDGRLLVTEKAGRLRLVSADGARKVSLTGVLTVDDNGQGGLLDVAIDPEFASNSLIYLSFSEPGPGRTAGTSVFRAKLFGAQLTEGAVIWRQAPKVRSAHHFGSRLVFAPDKTLFITTGDRGSQRNLAQKLDNGIGKTIRINRDGTVPKDNPFVGVKDALPEIWSYGHRNMQGAYWNSALKKLITIEHGPQGGDEINLDEAGKNYGWPKVTFGREYSGLPIGPTAMAGMTPPLHQWTPSIAPCGAAYYDGKAFPQWQGRTFVAVLKFKYLEMLTFKGTKVVAQQKLLADLDRRVRDVIVGPDGFIYVAFDEDQSPIMRLRPA